MTSLPAIAQAFERKMPPEASEYLARIQTTMAVLSTEAPELRPRNSAGLPGSLLRLLPEIPVIIVPDLHARRDFMMSLLASRLPQTTIPGVPSWAGSGTVIEALKAGEVQVLCLGDGFHAEARAIKRWEMAYSEYLGGFRNHEAMDQEMTESLGLMEMVMIAKTGFPGHFHFLKGNHENVLNEEGNGNHGFYKFVEEGAMVLEYLENSTGAISCGPMRTSRKACPSSPLAGASWHPTPNLPGPIPKGNSWMQPCIPR